MKAKITREYINSIKFWLLDCQNTFENYKGYKVKEFENIIDQECIEKLSDYQKEALYSNIESKLYESRYNLYLIYKEDKTKRDIRSLKTAINYAGSLVMRNIVEEYAENENQKRAFSVKLYLYHYDIINEIMHELLSDLILGTE